MQTLSTWENIVLGAMVLLIIFWMRPGIKSAIAQSRQTKSDWQGLIMPMALVVMFVILLIMMA